MVLAMICFGFNTGYSLIKEMKRARGGRWSTQSGAVYRIFRKLEALELVTTNQGYQQGRKTHIVHATDLGLEQVKLWVTSPMPFGEIALLTDPMRSRAYYLSMLELQQRLSTVEMWIKANNKLITQLKGDVDETFWLGRKDDPFKPLAYSEIIRLAEARGQWLLEVKALCEKNQVT